MSKLSLQAKNDKNKAKVKNDSLVKQQEFDGDGDKKQGKLTASQIHLKNVLKNQVLFPENQLDEGIFESDLVIKLQVPTKQYIKRSQKLQLGSILRKFPKNLFNAYEAAYEDLYEDMMRQGDDSKKQNNNERQLLIRQFYSFQMFTEKLLDSQSFKGGSIDDSESTQQLPNARKKAKKFVSSKGQYEEILMNCIDQYTGILDSFIITYNSLIYSLQQLCGFNVRSFMVTDASDVVQQNLTNFTRMEQIRLKSLGVKRYIYILLHLPHERMIKGGNKYRIKKQINYELIDPFINQPTDKVQRPLRFNTILKQIWQKNVQNTYRSQRIQSQNSMLNENPQQDLNSILQRRKTFQRKIGLRLPDLDKGTAIINEIRPDDRQIQKFTKFSQELDKKIEELARIGDNVFQDQRDPDAVTPGEKAYLLSINRFKYNSGVEKCYIQLKKQRRYYKILKELSQKYGYKTYKQPKLYCEFALLQKSQKFFLRLKNMLKYREIVCGPSGQLSLFSKMQRIKISYAILRDTVRVQNLHMIKGRVFALNDNYEKFGDLGHKASSKFHYYYREDQKQPLEEIKGGLNGRNLSMDWHRIFIWITDYNTIRSYLGESKAFQVFIKTRLIYLFVFLTPLGVVFEAIKNAVVAPKAKDSGYQPQFWFYLSYMIISTVVYGIFLEKYRREEQNFIKNFNQERTVVEFLDSYRGPYLRDSITDNANTYDSKYWSFKDKIYTVIVFLIMFCIVAAEIGFYYGMRAVIVSLSYEIPQFDQNKVYFFYPLHLVGYSIFFTVNALLYRFAIVPLAAYLTNFQNRPTKSSFKQSQNLKLYIFAIGIEMIGPIDLVFIQYSEKTSCSSSWCAEELQAYVYCRYFILLSFTLMNFLWVGWKFLRSRKVPIEVPLKSQLNFGNRLMMFLEFIYKESQKQQCSEIKLVDETVALIHFATFLTVFPLAPAISFISMLMDYNLERHQILNNQQRPISKFEQMQTFRKMVTAIGHWMLFYNFAQLFITLEWLEYLFQNVVYDFLPEPTPYGMMTLKYVIILFFTIIFEILLFVVKWLVAKTHNLMDVRKWNMYKKYNLRSLNSGSKVVLKLPQPLVSISRTYNLYQDEMDNKSSSDNSEKQASQEQGPQGDTNGQLQFGNSGKKKKQLFQ